MLENERKATGFDPAQAHTKSQNPVRVLALLILGDTDKRE
jgi:hypothetical protein